MLQENTDTFYLRRCLHAKFHPGTKSSLPMAKYLLLFTRFCRDEILSRDELIPAKTTDEISLRDEKKKKRRVNTSFQDEILK